MKLTGERPWPDTPDPLLALHRGYRQVRARMGDGRFLDVGCGLGDESIGFAGEGGAARRRLRPRDRGYRGARTHGPPA